MRIKVVFAVLALFPGMAWSSQRVYTFTCGDYNSFLDQPGIWSSFAPTMMATLVIDTVPSITQPGENTYNALYASIDSGAYHHEFPLGNLVVMDNYMPSPGEEYDILDGVARSEVIDGSGGSYIADVLSLQLAGNPNVLGSTDAPTHVDVSSFTSHYFSLQMGATPTNYGSYVDGQILGVTVQSVPEPAAWMALGLGAVGLLRRRSCKYGFGRAIRGRNASP